MSHQTLLSAKLPNTAVCFLCESSQVHIWAWWVGMLTVFTWWFYVVQENASLVHQIMRTFFHGSSLVQNHTDILE
jgi:hypothetical protein